MVAAAPERRVSRASFGRAGLLAICSTLLACGAKTGLPRPDAEIGSDAGVDASIDAGVDAGARCIPIPPGSDEIEVELELPIELRRVDVLFLLDATASMEDEIEEVRDGIRDVVIPGVLAAIPDPAFGVALTGEFPVLPHGPVGILPYDLRLPMTEDLVRVESALTTVPSWGNEDEPESQIEGLYQVATGEGISPWVPAASGCPMGGRGGVCFRRDALPVVVMITDAPMNEGPPGIEPESHYGFPGPHTYARALEASRALGIVVIGLGARDRGMLSPLAHLRQLAIDTGAVDARGPLVIDIGPRGVVDEVVVRAIERLAAGLPVDVVARLDDAPGDLVDARPLAREITPLAVVPVTAGRIDTDRFVSVRPGATVRVRVAVDVEATRALEPRLRAQGFEPPFAVPAILGFHRETGGLLGEVPLEIRWGPGVSCDE